MAKQVNIYVRFSPRPDNETSRSNAQQEERCRAYCSRHEYDVAAIYSDVAVSGKKLHRPELSEAIDTLRPGMILLVDSADRLARDMLVCLTIRFQVEKAGCTIEYADGSPTHTTPEGSLFQNILAAFAQYERERSARRTKAGMAKKKLEGVWIGRPPIGWQIDPVGTKQLIRHEREQAAINESFVLASQGENSLAIADFLTQSFGPCRGKSWSARTVRKILAKKANVVQVLP